MSCICEDWWDRSGGKGTRYSRIYLAKWESQLLQDDPWQLVMVWVRMDPHELTYFDVWALVRGTTWQRLGLVVLLEEVCRLGGRWGFWFHSRSTPFLFLSPSCGLDASSQLLVPCMLAAVLPSMTVRDPASETVSNFTPQLNISSLDIALVMVSPFRRRTITKA